MRLTYANCLLGGLEPGDVLASDEPLVADRARCRVIVPDADFDPDEAQALNERMWALGFDWPGDPDPTMVDGISAADLAGVEATQKILLPAVRGVLEADAILREVRPDALDTVVAESADAEYVRVERVLCAAVAATLRARLGALEVRERRLRRPRQRRARGQVRASPATRARAPTTTPAGGGCSAPPRRP